MQIQGSLKRHILTSCLETKQAEAGHWDPRGRACPPLITLRSVELQRLKGLLRWSPESCCCWAVPVHVQLGLGMGTSSVECRSQRLATWLLHPRRSTPHRECSGSNAPCAELLGVHSLEALGPDIPLQDILLWPGGGVGVMDRLLS